MPTGWCQTESHALCIAGSLLLVIFISSVAAVTNVTLGLYMALTGDLLLISTGNHSLLPQTITAAPETHSTPSTGAELHWRLFWPLSMCNQGEIGVACVAVVW